MTQQSTERTSDRQHEIARALGVVADLDPAAEAERRIAFLADYLTGAKASGYVLGISGGVDSTVAGKLAQLACERAGGRFTAVRLPHGAQADEHDAQAALEFIGPDEVVTVDIKPAVEPLHAATTPVGGYPDRGQADFVKGNIKARLRMTAQYAVAGRLGALVIGTDQAAEAVMGFFTKHGDGAADVTPLAGLTKDQVRQIGVHLGAPENLVHKVPTADLEEDRPALPDETAHGVTYAEIDTYLTGGPVSEEARSVIEAAYDRTAHKRALPAAPVELG
ncbi:ammonia-dependent NAD(+) synthetase [Nocardioides campestrisoli]|uniref:ammonia-dependent NAD(+) synthetase n=1 Tax=Nocardioides campestrisoli TaxID=2736757 RepID=UPI0015E6550F|nr:ammonia-dependent NAD(+) synthetase [Nocardioides campestrisoli]